MSANPGIVSAEENLSLTSTSAGTAMGNLLRRYWWPIAISSDLKDRPTLVRVMGEDLVLFRDRRNRLGLVGAHCPHRRANLCIGTVGLEGLRCRYHGWLFDYQGKLLDTPGVALDADFKDSVHHLAYPVEELGGLIFTYMGPQPAPLLPHYDFLVGPGKRIVRVIGFADSNWLQLAENGVDPLHVTFAHGMTWKGVASAPVHMSFDENEWGLIYRSCRPIDKHDHFAYREQYWLMPGITLASEGYGRMTSNDLAESMKERAVLPRGARYNVPIDDTHTMMIRVIWLPEGTPAHYTDPLLETPDWRQVAIEPYHEYKRMQNQTQLGYEWPDAVSAQDATILDSMGPLSDRENEHLMPSDGGVVIIRKILRDAVATVQSGGDPKGTLRDATRNRDIEVPAFEEILTKAGFEAKVKIHTAAE